MTNNKNPKSKGEREMNSKRKYNGVTEIRNENGAIFQIMTVQRNGRADSTRPRIQFNGDWLPEMGFVNGALIQSLPEPNGFVFNLCNYNTGTYSDLFDYTRRQGGTLVRAYLNTDNNQARFVTTGSHIYKSGLVLGDNLVAKCEYGRIRVRKITGNVRLVYVSRSKQPRTGEPVPMVFLLGDWLEEIGFASDTLVTVAAEPGCITFKAHSKAIIYSEVVKYARQHKMQLQQVSIKDGSPLITHTGKRVIAAGFRLGEVFVAEYEYGIIKLKKLEPEQFGFPAA